jgi:hypothetical protein
MGYLAALVWFSTNNCVLPIHLSLIEAAEGGHLEIAQWISDQLPCGLYDYEAMGQAAASHRQVDMMRWLVESGHLVANEDLLAAAARGGSLEMVKLLRERHCPWDSYACAAAAAGGHLDLLKWLRGEGVEWDSLTSYQAVAYGHLAVLKWVVDNGCLTDRRLSCITAARHGHAEVIGWARDNGFHYEEGVVLEEARHHRRGEVVEWIRANPFRVVNPVPIIE